VGKSEERAGSNGPVSRYAVSTFPLRSHDTLAFMDRDHAGT